jgi:hypothetical protein
LKEDPMNMFARAPFSTRSTLCAAALLLTAAAGCSHDDGAPIATGSALLGVSLPASVNITTIHYTISGNGITPITDTVGDGGTTLSGIPQGTNYLVEFSSASTDGQVTCAGKSNFDINSDALTQVTVVMHCKASNVNTGSVQVNGVWCPVLASYTATPLSVPVGGQITVTATATDLDTTDDGTPTFLWSATSGSFASPTSATTRYTCTAVGTQTLTINIGGTSPTVNLSTCADSRTTTVTCTQPVSLCGNGVIDTGEECDPPNTPATNFAPGCDATCKITGSLCSTCEASKCDAFYGQTGAWGCAGLTGTAKTDCLALLSCIRTSHCATAGGDAQRCYCGTASDSQCLGGGANGACKTQYETAAGTSDFSVIINGFVDPTTTFGLVNNQITCDGDTGAPVCMAVCPL